MRRCLALCATGLLAACSSPPPPDAYVPVADPYVTAEQRSPVVFYDENLPLRVPVGSVRQAWTEDSRVRALAQLQNLADQEFWIQTQVVFKDANGNIVEESVWSRRRLDPKGTIQLDVAAMNEKSSDFVFRVRAAR